MGEDEAREAAAKAAPLLAAIGAGAAARRAGAAPPRRASRAAARGRCRGPTRRPALYETLLVLARRAAGPRRPPRAARGEPARALRPRAAGRRSPSAPAPPRPGTSAPGCGSTCVPGADAALLVTPAAPPGAGRCCAPSSLPGGLGPHKWRDRTLLEAHEADDPATLPLLLDADGVVLETSRTSVVATGGDGTLPHAAGRRPHPAGRHRRGAAARARARLTLDDLRAADALYVASALRGLQPATLA